MGYPVVHWEIGGPDAAALREFYGKAFDWKMIDAGPDYSLVDGVDEGLPGGIMQTRQNMPSYVTVYIRVPDLDAKLSEIQQLGGTVVVPPTQISDTMSFALFSDPGGAVVGLLQGLDSGR
ncbi:VOC family protein [Nocardia sp. ET3-3]|uniref:VOC family protein n=1 Tax=Nocardia terrae TaxID=2675851 RepID=A0A7K1UTC0_9NOCA|nr:VOC family protein [Nocardia terrae]MVU77606.1 VOC family protein [Nocardia terrae]